MFCSIITHKEYPSYISLYFGGHEGIEIITDPEEIVETVERITSLPTIDLGI